MKKHLQFLDSSEICVLSEIVNKREYKKVNFQAGFLSLGVILQNQYIKHSMIIINSKVRDRLQGQ